jgi:tetratricopeptide (TPR) repeat protein
MRCVSGALIAAAMAGQAHVAFAEAVWPGDFPSSAGMVPAYEYGAFGRGRPPGLIFGYSPQYLLMRRYTAVNGLGTVSRGTPQLPAAPRRSTVLARAAREATRSLANAASEPAGDRFAGGQTAFRNGDYYRAIDEWSKECAAGAPNPVLLLVLGQAYFAAEKYSEAAAATQAALRALPEDRWSIVISNRGELYDDPRVYNFQVHQLAEAVEEHPRDPALRFLLGYHYTYVGYPHAALEQLEHAVRLDQRDDLTAELRDTLRPDPFRGESPVIFPGRTPEPEKPRSQGSRRNRRGANFRRSTVLADAAAGTALSLVNTASEPAGHRIARGATACRKRDYSKAIQEWSKECAAGAPNPVLEMMLGQAYFAAQKYDEAATATQAAMRALPRDRWNIVLSNRNELYVKPQLYEFQVQQLAEAVQDHPRDPALRFLLGYHYAYGGYPDAALHQLDQVAALEPRDDVAAELRATLQPGGSESQPPLITPGGTTPPEKPQRRRPRSTPRGDQLAKSPADVQAGDHSVSAVRLRRFLASRHVNNLKETGVTSNHR